MRIFGGKITALRTKAVLVCSMGAAAALPLAARAVTALEEGAEATGAASGLTTMDLATFVGRIIYAFLGLLGIIAVGLVIYAGFLWMTAQGNDEKIKLAKRILANAAIGLAVIMGSSAIVFFVLRALADATGGGSISTGGGGQAGGGFIGPGRGSGQLGNGVIEYHYPEPGQNDIPRNTKISITFKKPLVLSSVFRNYDDKGTFTIADDTVGGAAVGPQAVLQLNMDNVRLIANGSLAAGGSGTIDAQFAARHPFEAAIDGGARVTVVAEPMVLGAQQTLVIKPVAPLGSPTSNVNYRLALRGGESGVRVWTLPASGGTPTIGPAFPRAYADGGYFWSFTTNTTIDTTPPKIVAVEPVTTNPPGSPESSVLDRNQLLQIYFNEPVDPTTATGLIGAGGFANLEVKAVCRGGQTCTFNNGQLGTVSGEMTIGNRNQTLEFIPNAACEGVSQNSCGQTVYCLPKNVTLTVRALAATIGSSGPTAIASNGVVDMADNSLDGNNDGVAQGPQGPVQPGGRALDYYRNNPPGSGSLASVSDTARWDYLVGSNVDLVPPHITVMDPPPPPSYSTLYPDGPSNVPPLLNPSITWSKTMSVSSLRTGGFDELKGEYLPSTGTLFLRSSECAKTNRNAACPIPASKCPCTNVEPPGFFVDAGQPITQNGVTFSKTTFMHPVRPFYTANDLGYTDADIAAYPENIPQYVPIARSEIRDTKQNCFWPSRFQQCTTSATGQTSCCNRTASPDSGFISNCAP